MPIPRTTREQPRPRGKPRGIRRDRDCVTCKARGLKCDLNRPQCLPCVQAGLACGGYPLRVVWLNDRRRGSKAALPRQSSNPRGLSTSSAPATSGPAASFTAISVPSTYQPPAGDATPGSPYSPPYGPLIPSPTASSSSHSSHTAPSTTSTTSLFIRDSIVTGTESWCETDQNSLIKQLAALCNHILTTEDAQAPLVNQYLSRPETTGLLSDLCIFIQARLEGRNPPATQQRPKHENQQQEQVEQHAESLDMVRHRLTALARVNRAIEAANPFAFLGIATFAVFEVCDTTFGEWQCHLYGARCLLDYHRCRNLADLRRLATFVPGLMGILARLVWFDVSGSVVRGSATTPLIFDDWHRQVLLDDEFFATVGLPADTCALYVDVAKARLARRPVQACLRAAEQVLRVEEPWPAKDGQTRLGDWLLSANVNRCAAALAVLGQVRETAKADTAGDVDAEEPEAVAEDRQALDATTAAAVEKLCATLANTPASSRFYIHMAVGAYMAGMHARTREQCAIVRQYWLNCNISGISRYPGGLARCDEHWRRIGVLVERTEANSVYE